MVFFSIVGESEKEGRGAKTSAGELERLAVDGSLFIGNPPPWPGSRQHCLRSSAEASPSLAPPRIRSPKSEGSRPSFQTTCHSALLRPTSSQSNCPFNVSCLTPPLPLSSHSASQTVPPSSHCDAFPPPSRRPAFPLCNIRDACSPAHRSWPAKHSDVRRSVFQKSFFLLTNAGECTGL
jgi:hypothetical protein